MSTVKVIAILLLVFLSACNQTPEEKRIAELSSQEQQCHNYYNGGSGVTRDYVEARKCYQKVAEQGLSSAQNKLGLMYDEGKGGSQNYNEAIKWYKMAAEQGNHIAQYNLGMFNYNKGHDVEAYQWFLDSSTYFDDAKKMLDEIEKKLTPEQITKLQQEKTVAKKRNDIINDIASKNEIIVSLRDKLKSEIEQQERKSLAEEIHQYEQEIVSLEKSSVSL